MKTTRNPNSLHDLQDSNEVQLNSIELESSYGNIRITTKITEEIENKNCCQLFSKLPFNRKQIVVILLLCYGNFCVGSAYSLLAPFFPIEAQIKGVSFTWIGLIIAEYDIAMLLGGMVFGKLIPPLNPKFILIIGLIGAGICSISFGSLQWSPPDTTFISLGMALRTLEGLGGAAFFTSCWTLICLDFPKHISKLFATTEMCFGAGIIFGPAIGGILNQLGKEHLGAGFCLPFFVNGILILICAVLIHFRLPESKKIETFERTGVFSVLSHFSVTLNVLICVNCFLLIGFNEATLELHLETIQKLSPLTTGAIFMISGTVYAICNQMWAHLAEKMDNCHYLCVIGAIFSLLAFTCVGPLPFFPTEPKLWLVIVGQVFLGLGMGGQFVGSFTQGLRESLKSGFPDNVSTYAVVSGIYSSAVALGSAIGPALGGYLLEKFGYRWATVPIVALQLLLILTIVLYNVLNRCYRLKTN